jgi:hypothetical protein
MSRLARNDEEQRPSRDADTMRNETMELLTVRPTDRGEASIFTGDVFLHVVARGEGHMFS